MGRSRGAAPSRYVAPNKSAHERRRCRVEALTAKAALVDPAALETESTAITTQIPRIEIEEAARADGPAELFLDVARVRDGDRETHEIQTQQRITVSWNPDDLEKLLGSTTSDHVTLAFKPEELARMLDEPDVDAHGLRERIAILTVAATTAAGLSAGVASAMNANPTSESGGGGGTTAAFVTDTTSSGTPSTAASSQFVTDATSSGPGASTEASTGGTPFLTDATSSGPGASTEASTGGTPFLTDATSSGPGASTEASTGGTQFLTDATSSGPGASTEAATTSGGGESFIESTGGQVALAGGLALLILAAGFVGTRQRGGPQPA